MVNKSHFSRLYPGKTHKPSDFDSDAFDNFSILPLSKQGAKASLERMANKLLKPYLDDIQAFLTLDSEGLSVPNIDSAVPGWQPCKPTAKVLIFDIETMVMMGGFPIMATALDATGQVYTWYPSKFGQLIELPDDTLVIGHNVSFDAQGLANSFQGLEHGCLFMDTMSMANSCYGFCSSQFWVSSAKDTGKSLPIWAFKGYGKSNYKSLKDTYYHLYPDASLEDVDKSIRDIFVKSESLTEIKDNYPKLMAYNIQDVKVTLKVFQRLFPYWQAKNPSPISLMGSVLSSTYKLPLVDDWYEWIEQVDNTYATLSQEIEDLLMGIADTWVVNGNQGDVWSESLNWEVKPKARKLKGYPEWYRKEIMSKGKITLKSRTAHALLQMTYDGEPVYHTKKDGYRTQSCKIPHPDGVGNVGYLFSKDLLPLFENGQLQSQNPKCQEVLNKAISLTYWTSVQSRVKDAFVVNGWTLPQTGGGTVTGRVTDPLWLTTCDAKSHLVGSELKSRIRCPKGYKFLNADFSSQEMRIAWTLGDSVKGKMGSSEMSRSGIVGDKEKGTDAHSTLANKLSSLIGKPYPRQDAKVAGFSMLYMAGVKAVASYIRMVVPEVSIERSRAIAKEALEYRRGRTIYGSEGRFYEGGTDSDAYNAIDKIANQDYPRTPLLKREMPDPLCPKYVKDDFYTTRANWVVQGTARDELDCLSVALTFMFRHAGLKAKLIWSRHDEVIIMAPENEIMVAAELMQQAHCFTWAAFHESLNLLDLPTPGLLFDSIDVDETVRKDPTKDISTPSLLSDPVSKGYSIPATSFKGFEAWDEIHNIADRLHNVTDLA